MSPVEECAVVDLGQEISQTLGACWNLMYNLAIVVICQTSNVGDV